MSFAHILKLVRHRWYVPFGLALVGALALTVFPRSTKAAEQKYFRATHTLIAENGSEANLQQATVLVKAGDVPTLVADDLGLQRDEFARRVTAVARPDLGTVLITAVATDEGGSVALADAHADALLQVLASEQTSNRDEDLAVLESRLEAADRESQALSVRLAQINESTDPENPDPALEAERIDVEAKIDQLRAASTDMEAQIAELDPEGDPDPGFETLEAANSFEITRDEYASRLREGSAGPTDPTNQGRREFEEFDLPGQASGGVAKPIRAAAGAAVGFGAGIVILLLLDRTDRRIRNKEEAQESFRLPVIAEIPPFTADQQAIAEIIAVEAARSPIAEAYRSLRTSLLAVARQELGTESPGTNGDGADERQSLVVMVVSAGPEEGKTTTTANLAAVLAEAHNSVLVFNCDYRRPRLHLFFDDDHPETADEGRLDAASGARAISTRLPGVKMVTGVGEGNIGINPSDIIEAQRRIVGVARRFFDIVLIDTAPVLLTADASELIPDVDLVVLVARAGKTHRSQAEAASELLQRLGAPVLGVVLTDSKEAVITSYAGYGYYYTGSTDERRRRSSSRSSSTSGSAPAAVPAPPDPKP